MNSRILAQDYKMDRQGELYNRNFKWLRKFKICEKEEKKMKLLGTDLLFRAGMVFWQSKQDQKQIGGC